MINPWSSKPAVIETLLDLFNATTRCIDTLSPEDSLATRETEPKTQMPELAALLLACLEERLSWLRR